MNKTIKKLFSALVLLVVLFTSVAGQGSVAFAAKQAEGESLAPLAPGYTWDNLGQTTRSITLNIKGDTLSLSGETFQAAERFEAGVPADLRSFYSNEQLAAAGWVSDNAFETPAGLHQVFYHDSGVYLAVDFTTCADNASLTCVTVWLSENASAAPVIAGPELPASSIVPDATGWGKTAPVDGSTVSTPTSVTLSWTAYSPTPEKYSYCIKAAEPCLDSDPNWTGNYTGTSVNLSLASGVKYYWQVRAVTCGTCTPKTMVYANGGSWWNFTTTSNTITGNAGVAGATLTYVDSGTKTVTADASGNYIINPSYNWTGTVTPSKSGYTFSPVSRPYSSLKTNITGQNYTATSNAFTISGNAGTPGATLSYTDGTAKTVTADGTGAYTVTVSYGWSGTITPSKNCMSFTPASVTYSGVSANLSGYNYTAVAANVVIAGNTGVGSVNVGYTDGVTPLTTVSDGSGNYSISLSCPFSGTVTPTKAGFTFSPASKTYSSLGQNKNGQNYTTYVAISGNAGVGASVGYMLNGTYTKVAADGSGNYTLDVPYNWSGTLTPLRAGFVFTPKSIAISGITSAQTGKDFVQAAGINISGALGTAGANAALNFTDGSALTVYADASGNYTLAVTTGFTGDVTPSKSGYVFAPTKKTYTAIAADQTAQNYTTTASATFGDVPTSFWAWQQVEALVKSGITSGCGSAPMTFCPGSIVNRDVMAVFLVKAKYGASYVPPAATGVFADVSSTYWAAPYIEKLAADNITGGCSATPKNFCPSSPVTRDQMAVFLLKTKYGAAYVPPTPTGVFADVSNNYWAASFIEQLSAEGVTSGCSVTPKNYCPSAKVTRDQMAVFLTLNFWLK